MSPIRRLTPEDADPAAETAIEPPAADETELIPPDQAPTLAAWSLCPEVVEYPDQSRSWPLVWGVTAACIGAVALLVGAVGLTAWALHPAPSSVSSGAVTTLTEMVPALAPPVTVTAMPPTQTWNPPPPSTTTVTVQAAPPPKPPAYSVPSDNDEAFFTRLRQRQIIIYDESKLLWDARWVCSQLAAGRSKLDVMNGIHQLNPRMTEMGVIDFTAASVAYYCPEYGS